MIVLIATSYPLRSLILTLFFFALFLCAIGTVIWAAVDAIRKPSSSFKAAGSSKALWLVLVIAPAVLLPFLGVSLAIIYLAAIRPRINSTGTERGAWPNQHEVGLGAAVLGSDEGIPPAGWYPDPEDPSTTRLWSGSAWTDSKRGSDGLPPVS